MKYELVVTNDGKPHLGVSVGTVYQNVQDIVYKIDCIELFNLVYVPRTEEFMFNKKIRLSQGLVDYYESLNLYSLFLNLSKSSIFLTCSNSWLNPFSII